MTKAGLKVKMKTEMEAEGLEYQEDWELEKLGYDIEELYQKIEKLQERIEELERILWSME